MSDLYKVPVTFVDSESPTARKLNKWALQIDTAFTALERILGTADSNLDPTFLTNLARALGNIGWLDTRLPMNVADGITGEFLPTVVQRLESTGKKEALLTFFPQQVIGQAVIVSEDLNGDGDTGDWTRVFTQANLNAANKYLLNDRRLVTTTVLDNDAKVTYVVDPTNSYDAYTPSSGSTLVPNLYEVALSEVLCAYEEIDELLYITFPKINLCMNPAMPFSTTEGEVLDLSPAGAGIVKWTSANTQPSYTVPDWIYAAAEDGDIPDGLCSLWVKVGAGEFQKVEGADPLDPILFRIAASKTMIEIVLPADLQGSMPHDADVDLTDQYIVGFIGVSAFEALLHERARSIHHKHDGSDDGSLIDAGLLKNRFNPATCSPSIVTYNHFPQYLLRTGYSPDTDPLNNHNGMDGDIFFLGTAGTVFGDYTDGPKAAWASADIEIGRGPSGTNGSEGKLQFSRKNVRFNEGIFFGDDGSSAWLKCISGGAYIGSGGLSSTTAMVLQTGALWTYDGILYFQDEGQILSEYQSEDVIGDYTTFIFKGGEDGTDEDLSRIKVDSILTETVKSQVLVLDGGETVYRTSISPIEFSPDYGISVNYSSNVIYWDGEWPGNQPGPGVASNNIGMSVIGVFKPAPFSSPIAAGLNDTISIKGVSFTLFNMNALDSVVKIFFRKVSGITSEPIELLTYEDPGDTFREYTVDSHTARSLAYTVASTNDTEISDFETWISSGGSSASELESVSFDLNADEYLLVEVYTAQTDVWLAEMTFSYTRLYAA